jgi:hypothetical protein
MANKRSNSETSQINFKKLSIPQIRTTYRKYGTNIRIGRADYTINFCSFLFLDSQECHGLCDTVSKQIYVKYSPNDKDLMEQTLLHEIVHAALDECGVSVTSSWSTEVEEMVVEAVSRDLANLYRFQIRPEYKPS